MSAAAPATDAAPAPGGVRRRLPRRSTVVIVLVVLLTLAAVAVLGGTAVRSAPLDPDNPGPDGARAVAQVLADEGVEVEVVRDADALEGTEVDGATTVLVTSAVDLGAGTADRLLEHAEPGRVVVAGAGVPNLEALGVEANPLPSTPSAEVPAACDPEVLTEPGSPEGLAIEVDVADAYDGPGCFGTDDGSLLVTPREGLVLLGAQQVLANDTILGADNAAVALRLLGAGDRLVWYVPDPADLSATEAVSITDLLPPWLVPSLWLLLGTSLVAIVWRGRRFGPLATEPLPVRVRASETTRSRGRLYHRVGDRAHAADSLRRATRDRLAERLGATGARPPSGAPDPLVAEVSRLTGRPPEAVAHLVSPGAPPPASEADLIALAAEVAELDREVRRP